jgi:hypothetical protein
LLLEAASIVLKPDPVIDPVQWSGHGSDGLTRVNPGQPKKNIFNSFLYNYNIYSSSAWPRVGAGW